MLNNQIVGTDASALYRVRTGDFGVQQVGTSDCVSEVEMMKNQCVPATQCVYVAPVIAVNPLYQSDGSVMD